jgi:hypothetical protein
MSGRPTAAAEDRGALRRRSGRRFIGGSIVVSGERIAPRPSGRREFPSRVSSLCCGFWRDTAACGAVAQRSAGYVSVDVPVMRTVTTHSGRGFMVQGRFAGDGSIYLRRQ